MASVKYRLDNRLDPVVPDELRTPWLNLVDADSNGSVYLHPDFVAKVTAKDPQAVVVVAIREDETSANPIRSLAILRSFHHATFLSRLGTRFRLRARKLATNRILGAADAETIAPVVREFVEMLKTGEEDLLFFEDVELDSPLWKCLSQVDDRRVRVLFPKKPQGHWWILLPSPPEEYWNKFSSKSRYNLRRQAKKLEHTFSIYETRDDVLGFLEKAHRISTKSWQSKRLGLRVTNDEPEKRFWDMVASLGAMRCYVLEQGDTPIAFVMGVQWKGGFLLEEIGYDPAFADFSPGAVLLFRVMEDLTTRSSPERFDFGFGDGAYKQIFGNHETQSGSVILVRRGVFPSTVMWLEKTRVFLSERSRAFLNRSGLLARLRRTYRK